MYMAVFGWSRDGTRVVAKIHASHKEHHLTSYQLRLPRASIRHLLHNHTHAFAWDMAHKCIHRGTPHLPHKKGRVKCRSRPILYAPDPDAPAHVMISRDDYVRAVRRHRQAMEWIPLAIMWRRRGMYDRCMRFCWPFLDVGVP